MNSVTEPRNFLSGKLSQVDVGKIEKELRGLWKQATNAEDGVSGDVVRAVSFTLVLFSTDESTENELENILDDIMAYHPCRAILVFSRENKPHALDAYVTARCHLLDAKRHVCSEQIVIHADGSAPEEISSVVSPLVLADLPVVLWWRSRNFETPIMRQLQQCSRKVVFDSGYEPFVIEPLRQAADLVIGRADCIWLADLNWRRLNSWRRSLAEAFDGFPMESDYLSRIKSILINVGGNPKQQTPPSTQALLLSGWLASRLGWHIERDRLSRSSVIFSDNDKEFQVNFAVTEKGSEFEGQVDSVVIDFDDNRKLTIEVERSHESFLLVAHEQKTGSKETSRCDYHFAEGVLLGQELEVMTRDRVFEQSLLVAGELTRLITSSKQA